MSEGRHELHKVKWPLDKTNEEQVASRQDFNIKSKMDDDQNSNGHKLKFNVYITNSNGHSLSRRAQR